MTGLVRKIFSNFLASDLKFYCTAARKPVTSTNLTSILSSIYQMDTETLKTDKLGRSTTRYDGRTKKRKWEDRRQEDTKVDLKKVCSETVVRIKKKKVIILFAYSGANYFGMQRNPGMKTIEEDLLNALLLTKNISFEAFNQIQTISFQRAARTDKGVSAAMQVVSLKMPDNADISEINKNLPPEIKVFDIKRVTKGFNSKTQCDGRTYTYLLPTFALENHKTTIENHCDYRVSQDVINKMNSVLKKFEGTKNFHNFTNKKKFIDPSSKRFIISFSCGEPFIMDGMEFAIIKVKGQSFVMHQIRKMVGLSLAIVRELTTEDKIDQAFTSDRIDIPTAPGLGLVLDEIHYDRYNGRYGSDGFHDALTWDNLQTELDDFKKQFIYPKIVSVEKGEMPMATWLETLPLHSYDIRDQDRPVEEDGENDESDDENGEAIIDKNSDEAEEKLLKATDSVEKSVESKGKVDESTVIKEKVEETVETKGEVEKTEKNVIQTTKTVEEPVITEKDIEIEGPKEKTLQKI